ncbi:MAG: hypothetical protein AAGG75_27775, partial [Bacteroidota bacterium]
VLISTSKGGITVKKKFDECQKKFTVGHKFLSQGERKEGIKLIRQAYKIAIEYDFSYLACELSSILHRHHTYQSRNIKSARHYASQVKKYLRNYNVEKEAEYYFYQIVMEQMHATVKPELLEETVREINQLKGESIKFKVYQGTINILNNLYKGEYLRIITDCTKALQYFEGKSGVYPAHHLFFLRNKGTAQTAIGQYEEAAISYEEAELYVANKPYNAYTLQYYKILNALHAQQYQIAFDLCQKSRRCKIEDLRQHFIIVEAYLHFLAHMGFLQLNRPFRISRYINDTFKAQEDKQGSNINILIAELLVYLVTNRGKFIDRIEAVQHYSYRHLKGSDTQRAKWFIKILCLLPHPKVNFHPVALQRKAKRYIDLLKNHPVRMGEGFAVEIIPFERLIEMIIEKARAKTA